MNKMVPKNDLTLQGLLRFAIQHTKTEDGTTDSQFKEMDKERKEFIENALKSMTIDVIEEFHKAIEILEKETSSKHDKLEALNVIRDFIDNLDFANNFIKVGGSKIVLKYLNSEDSELRVAATYVIAEMSQNNPYAQQHFVEEHVIPLLIANFKENQEISSSSLHAISSLVRTFPQGLIEFLSLGGIKELLSCLNSQQTRVFIKACFLIACLSSENEHVRDEFVTKSAFPKMWQFVEQPGDGYDVKIETVLFALSELSKSPKWQPTQELRCNIQNLLGEIIEENKELAQSEETVAYARLILENLDKIK